LRTSAKFLQERFPLNNVFLHNVRCLQPSRRMTAVGNQMITALAACIPQLSTSISFADNVVTEWRLYQADTDITADWFVSADGTNIPVDKYWSRVSRQGDDSLGHPSKYTDLMVVVKAALSVSHGQGDVERGFSWNNQIVDDIRIALKERTILALRTVKDVVNRFDNVRVQITSQLIRQFQGAHATYKADLESVAQTAQDKDAEKLTKVTEDKRKQTTEINRVEIEKDNMKVRST